MIYQLFFCLIGAYEVIFLMCLLVFFFQAEDGIRDLVRSRGLGDVYKRQSVRLRWCVRVAGRQLVAEEGPTPLLLADMTGQFDLVASPENGGLCLPEPTQGWCLPLRWRCTLALNEYRSAVAKTTTLTRGTCWFVCGWWCLPLQHLAVLTLRSPLVGSPSLVTRANLL
eukprot:TRINITY_DN3909_c0_g1_i4.p2 TRINITY_DN3909_c0_g1~~TRINITY_DN3909_c0_g1_i4.p2  ORF type:complete len:168 (-),score=24.31 TRINITY_DN3909_c0_g1_i4:457-960(-)